MSVSDRHPHRTAGKLPDAATFVEKMGGNPETAQLILQTACDDLKESTSRAGDAREANDVETLVRVFHSLRGSVSTLGAEEFGTRLLAWEEDLLRSREIRNVPWDEFSGLCSQYGEELIRLRATIQPAGS